MSKISAPWANTHSRRRASFSRPKKTGPQSGRLALKRRPRHIPRFWRRIDNAAFFTSEAMEGMTMRIRRLVLASQRIPFIETENDHIYAPPLYVLRANSELRAYLQENIPPAQAPVPFTFRNANAVLILQFFLVIWYGITVHWWPGTETLPAFDEWKAMGSLDVFRVAYRHEWWRCVTALTLHADVVHLLANVVFGAPFLVMLARHAGIGVAVFLVILSGTMGNILSVLYRSLAHNSLGFSTALFGCVGVLAGMAATRARGRGRVLLPLAAGIGILALLGTGDGEGNIDYGAHVFGLVSGLALGWVYGAATPGRAPWSMPLRIACLLGSVALIVVSWSTALSHWKV